MQATCGHWCYSSGLNVATVWSNVHRENIFIYYSNQSKETIMNNSPKVRCGNTCVWLIKYVTPMWCIDSQCPQTSPFRNSSKHTSALLSSEASVQTRPLTMQSHPAIPNCSPTHKPRTVHGSVWAKWKPVIFGCVTQSSCICDFWQCLDSVSQAKGSEICHSDEAQLSCTSPVMKGFSRQEGVVFLRGGKKNNSAGSHFSLIFFLPLLQWSRYLNWSNVNADFFSHRVSPKNHPAFHSHITFTFSCISVPSIITSHPGALFTIEEVKSTSVFEQAFRPKLFWW